MTPDDFIKAVGPAAKLSMTKTKIPASFVVAEGALESGWGDSLLSIEAYNLFGVKADNSWHGPTYSKLTKERLKGAWVTVNALWRKYDSWKEAIDDHASFLTNNPRYKPAFAYTGGDGFAHAIAEAGYATDPDYYTKISAIIRQHNLTALDTVLI